MCLKISGTPISPDEEVSKRLKHFLTGLIKFMMTDIIDPETNQTLKIAESFERVRSVTLVFAVSVFLPAALVILGWVFEIDFLKRLLPGGVLINPTSAAAFVLSAVALQLLQSADGRLIFIARFCAGIAAVAGLAKICAIAGIFNIGVDKIPFAGRLFDGATGQLSEMAPSTALNFLLLGAALLSCGPRTQRSAYFPAQYPAVAVFFTSFAAIIAYLYEAHFFYLIDSVNPAAMLIDVSFLLLATGLLLSRPERGITKELLSRETGGKIARRLFPLVVIMPAFLGWLELLGEKNKLFEIELGNAMLVVALISILSAIILSYARLMNGSARKREQTLNLIRQSEEKYRNILGSIEEGYFEIDLRGNFTFYNEALCSILGFDEGVVEKMNGRRQLDRVNRKKLLAVMIEIFKTGRPVSKINWEFTHQDNTQRFAESSISKISDAAGKPVGFRGIIRDVTAENRRKTESRVISEIIQGIATTSHLDELLRLVHASIKKVVDAENCYIALPDPVTDLMHYQFWIDKFEEMPGPHLPGSGFGRYVLETGRPLLLTDELAEDIYASGGVIENRGDKAASWLGVPLLTPSRTIGVLVVQNYEHENVYGGRDLEFLASVGDHIALAIQRKRAEEALALESTLMQALMDNIPDAIYFKDPESRFLRISRHAHLTGMTSTDEAVGKTTYDYYSEECARSSIEDDRRIVQSGEPLIGKEEMEIFPDGSTCWVSTTKVPIFDETGKVRSIVGISRDITGRKQSEEAFRKETSLIELLKTIAVAANESESVEETLQICLDKVCQLMKWQYGHVALPVEDSPDELMTAPIWYLDDRELLQNVVREMMNVRFRRGTGLIGRVLESGKAIWIKDVTEDSNFTRKQLAEEAGLKGSFAFPILWRSKVLGVMTFFSARIEEPDEKLLEVMTSIGSQIGQAIWRKKAEQKLSESQQLLKTVIDTLPQAIWWKNRDGAFAGANKFIADLAGFDSTEKLVGLTDYDLPWTKAESDFFRECDLRVMETGVPELNIIESLLNADGRQFWVNTNKAPLRNAGGEVVGIIGAFADITEQRRAEEDLQNSRDYLNRIINAVADPIFVNDRQHRMVLVNDAFCQLAGRSREEIIGKTPADLVRPEEALIFIEMDEQVFESGKETSNEEQMTDEQGNLIFLVTKRTIYQAPNGEAFIVGVINNITERIKTEAALRENEEKFRDLFDNAPVAYHELDMDGRFTRVNHTEEMLLGYTETELIGRHPSEIIAEKNSREATAAKLAGRMELQPVERTFIRKDGSPVTVLNVDRMIRDKQGKICGIRSTLQNITERKRIEAALEAAARRESAMLENALDVICSIDADGRFAGVSPASLKVWGYQPEELIGRRYLELVKPEDAAKTIAAANRIMSGTESTNFENCYLHKNGSLIDMVWSAFWLESEQLMFCVAHDMTERKRIEERQSAILDALPAHICLLDGAGKILEVNNEWKQFALENGYHGVDFGVGANYVEMCEKSAEACVDGARQAADICRAVLAGDFSVFEMEYSCHSPTEKKWFKLSVTPLNKAHQKEKSAGAVVMHIDISERKRIEEELEQTRDAALESVRMKSEFLANMSHEIRTPMNGVIGMTGILLDTNLSEEQQDYAQTVQASADSLLRIIDDILDFSKIEAGKLNFERIEFDLRECVESAVEILAGRAQTKGIEIASLVYRDVPTPLFGDPGRLRQVLTNLIGNAVKFTEKGEVTVKVHCEKDEGKYIRLRFEVIDTGIGISERAQRQLFQAFVQADGSTTRKYGGTGLGLAISKQLVEMMSGEISVESASGKGSIFRFTARFEKQPHPVSAAGPIGEASLEGVRVLIVDDNATNRKIFLHQTASWGMIAAEAASGRQALEILAAAAAKNEPFKIAILDLMMPEMDGFELARAIKINPVLAETSLVLLPSFGKRGHGQTAKEFGIDAYLQKPIRQSQLYDCLAAVIAGSAAERAGEEMPSPRLITRHSLRSLTKTGGAAPAAISGARILVAEDNPVNQKVALSQLKSLGYTAEIAVNGREAVAAVKKFQYDVVLMDCQMPEIDGFEAAAEIRNFEGDSGRTTIIAMTAHALEGERERCFAAGMNDYISKPVKLESLKETLDRWLGLMPPAPAGTETGTVDLSHGVKNHRSVDLSVLNGFKDLQQPDEPDLIEELIELFLTDAGNRITILKQTVDAGEISRIKELAHGIRGSSGNVGALYLAGLSERLERENLDLPAMQILISEIESEFQEVGRILADLRQGR